MWYGLKGERSDDDDGAAAGSRAVLVGAMLFLAIVMAQAVFVVIDSGPSIAVEEFADR